MSCFMLINMYHSTITSSPNLWHQKWFWFSFINNQLKLQCLMLVCFLTIVFHDSSHDIWNKICVKQMFFNTSAPGVKHYVSTWWQYCTEQLESCRWRRPQFYRGCSFSYLILSRRKKFLLTNQWNQWPAGWHILIWQEKRRRGHQPESTFGSWRRKSWDYLCTVTKNFSRKNTC